MITTMVGILLLGPIIYNLFHSNLALPSSDQGKPGRSLDDNLSMKQQLPFIAPGSMFRFLTHIDDQAVVC